MVLIVLLAIYVVLAALWLVGVRGPVLWQRRRWIQTPHGWVPEPTDDEFRQARANPGAQIERDGAPRQRPPGRLW